MQILLDIPDNYYENNIKKELPIILSEDNVIVILPKGHRRLIEQPTDADIAETIGGQNDFADCIREAVATVFENSETIVEADGGSEE